MRFDDTPLTKMYRPFEFPPSGLCVGCLLVLTVSQSLIKIESSLKAQKIQHNELHIPVQKSIFYL